MWTAIRAFLTTYGLIALAVAGALYVAWGFVAAPPPRQLTIAAGPEGSAYWEAAQRYRLALAREGITLTLRDSAGSVANLALLGQGAADLAFVQAGIAGAARQADIIAIGAALPEAVWLFRRTDATADRLGDLANTRVAVGPPGSGTRALAMALLDAAGVQEDEATLLPLAGIEAARALEAGEADAAMFVAAAPGPAINRLLRAPGVKLTDFSARGEAFVAAFPYLSTVSLPAGAVSLAEDLPPQAVTLLAPAAQLLAHDSIHPQIVALMVRIMTELHSSRTLFAPAGRFPSPLAIDVPLHPDAQRWFREGPSYLQRVAPFWVAVQVERLWVLAIPLLTIALPLLRFGPPLWRWQVESKIYRWYDQLQSLEAGLDAPGADRAHITAELQALDRRLAELSVPTAYMSQLYRLRADLRLVQERTRQAPA